MAKLPQSEPWPQYRSGTGMPKRPMSPNFLTTSRGSLCSFALAFAPGANSFWAKFLTSVRNISCASLKPNPDNPVTSDVIRQPRLVPNYISQRNDVSSLQDTQCSYSIQTGRDARYGHR